MTTAVDGALADVDSGRLRASRDGRPPPADRRRRGARTESVLAEPSVMSGPPPQVMKGPDAVRRADGRLLVTDPRPTANRSRCSQKYPTSREPSQFTARQASAGGQERVLGLDDTELVAFGVGEHDMRIVRALTDVEVPPSQLEERRDRLVLIVVRGGRELEVHAVLADLAPSHRLERRSGPRVPSVGTRPTPSVVSSATPSAGRRPRSAPEPERILHVECTAATSRDSSAPPCRARTPPATGFAGSSA